MKMTATEFKAKCLAVIDQVHRRGESVVITKHGKVVAQKRKRGRPPKVRPEIEEQEAQSA